MAEPSKIRGYLIYNNLHEVWKWSNNTCKQFCDWWHTPAQVKIVVVGVVPLTIWLKMGFVVLNGAVEVLFPWLNGTFMIPLLIRTSMTTADTRLVTIRQRLHAMDMLRYLILSSGGRWRPLRAVSTKQSMTLALNSTGLKHEKVKSRINPHEL